MTARDPRTDPSSDRATAELLAFAWEARQTSGPLKACDYEALIEHIKHALLEEREACAKVAESTAAEKPAYSTKGGPRPVKVQSMTRIAIAAAIRARSNPNEGK